MAKNLTITVDEEALRWARHEAAEKGTSVSKLVGQMLEREMRQTDAYWKAFARWKQISAKGLDVDAENRMSREEAHERRR